MDTVDRLLKVLASMIAEELKGELKLKPQRVVQHRDMSCRVNGCPVRSRGPRFRFMCKKHSSLPVQKQKAALAAWKVNGAASKGNGISEIVQ